MTKKIGIVLGTRPEIIKLMPLIKECSRGNLNYVVVHTNQHYSKNMDEVFFKELKIPKPKYNLNVRSGTQSVQTGKMLIKLDKVFEKEKFDVVLVQGDTNSVLAGALAAKKRNIPVGHIEAGLRSYDERMPEETNRVIVDHISDYLFCPTKNQKRILLKEGIDKNKVFVVGNTIVDSISEVKRNETDILKRLNLFPQKYVLMTLHRAENVDTEKRLRELVSKINRITIKIIFPIHPRTKKSLEKFKISLSQNIETIEPVNFTDLVTLQKNSKYILTDSGGIQEESCILKVPCITLRDNTERPETIKVGANRLLSHNLKKDLINAKNSKRNWRNPFGDGKTSKRILKIIKK